MSKRTVKKPGRCPKCKDEPAGVLEKIVGVAEITVADDGTWDWFGHTEVIWDCDEPYKAGGTTFQCSLGHEWFIPEASV